jgi:hypothetical protein
VSFDGIMVDSTSPVSGTVYDGLGKYMSVSYDGIMVDSTSPVFGTVYDGLGKYLCIIYIIRATNNCVI